MQIPLLTSAPAAFARRNVRPPARIGGYIAFAAGGDDAALTELLNTADQRESLPRRIKQGYLDSLGEYLQELGTQAAKIKSSLDFETLSFAQRQALEAELASLEAGFQQLKNDSRITSALQAIQASAHGDVLIEGLGEQFSNLLGAHQFGGLSRISAALAGLSSLSLLNSSSAALLSHYGREISSALSGAIAQEEAQAAPSATDEINNPITLIGKQQSFALGEGIALTLRTLDSRGMIQAAAAGLDQDTVSHLIIEIPRREKKKSESDPYEDAEKDTEQKKLDY